jgi:hypothetical protein
MWTAVVFALGTSVWSTSQALWQHPAAVLVYAAALLCMVRAEADERWAGRAGLPLALAVAARYADIALVTVLAIGVAVRWPRRIPHLVAWAAPVAVLVLAYHWACFGSPLRQGLTPRFSAPWGEGHLGLLVSPGKGLFVFTPIALIAVAGLRARAALRRSRARRHLRGRRPRPLAVRGALGGMARRRVLGPAAHDGRAPSPVPVPA